MLPRETLAALLPSSVRVGEKLVLRPMAALHAAVMESFGISLDGMKVDECNGLVAAFVLSSDKDELCDAMCEGRASELFARWTEEHPGVSNEDVFKAVNQIVESAFDTFVPGKKEGVGTIIKMDSLPTGYGWPLEVCECMCAEYGMTMDEAIRTPLSTAFGMMACARIRNGGEAGGPDYYHRGEMDMVTQIFRMMKKKKNEDA